MGVQDSSALHLVGDDAAHKVGVGAAESGHEVVEGLLKRGRTTTHHTRTVAGVGGHHGTVILCRIPRSSDDTHIHVLCVVLVCTYPLCTLWYAYICVHTHCVHSSVRMYVYIHTTYTLVYVCMCVYRMRYVGPCVSVRL